ncbi:chorismate mutase [Parathermosynechococcus lividus]
MEEHNVGWRVRAIRGATTATENSIPAIREAVLELLSEIERRNALDFSEVISVTFSVTRDLDQIFPAAIARECPHWRNIPLLDVQQMHVEGGLPYCIRCLIYVNTPSADHPIYHAYLRHAQSLRPDLAVNGGYHSLELSSHSLGSL